MGSASILLRKFLIWRIRHISSKNFLLILSVIIGITSGIAAILLKRIVFEIRDLLTKGFDTTQQHYVYVIYPFIGLLLTACYIYFLNRNKLGGGISNILYCISKKSSIIERDKMYSHFTTSALTVGFGGSVGLEAPIVTTSSAVASNLGRLMHLDRKQRTLLIGCGAAAATAAIFNAPITGIVFVLEVLLLDFNIRSFIPILLASVTGAITSKLLPGEDILFNLHITDPFIVKQLPLYVLLGLLSGVLSVYFSKWINAVEERFTKIHNRFNKAVYGGIALGILVFVFPPLYGEGFEMIRAILSGHPEKLLNNSFFYEWINLSWGIVILTLGIVVFKIVATGITIGGGGSGGIFGPSLFIGSLMGFAFSRICNLAIPGIELSESNFVLVGMAGVMSGILHAPLTSIFLIAELSTGYELMLPLILVSAISYATTIYFEPYSIYTKQLARKGDLIDHNKDKQVLTLLSLRRVIEKDLKTIEPDKTLGDLVKVVSKSNRNIFPVVDEGQVLCGIILLDDIREIMFNPELYDDTFVRDIMHMPPGYVFIEDPMDVVMKKFQDSGAWNLPVIDEEKYVGFLSKSKIFSVYRTLLINQDKQ